MKNIEQNFVNDKGEYHGNKEEDILSSVDTENSEYIKNMFLNLEHQGGNIEKRKFLRKRDHINENNNLPNLDDYESGQSNEN